MFKSFIAVTSLATLNMMARADVATLVVLPDTQSYVEYKRSTMTEMMNWIVANQSVSNILFVGHVGDVINDYASETAPDQWAYFTNEYAKFTAAGLPFSVLPGNHDYAKNLRDSSMMNSYFPLSTFTNMPTFGGAYDNLSDNTYHLVPVHTQTWLMLSLEFGPRSEVLDWANGVLAAHANYPAIVITHAYLNRNGERFVTGESRSASVGYGLGNGPPSVNEGSNIWETLIYSNQQVRMVVCGHDGDTNVGARLKIDPNIIGRPVYQMLHNYQYYNQPSYPGYLLLIEISSGGTVSFKNYSPTQNLTSTAEGSFGTLEDELIIPTNLMFSASGTNVTESAGAHEVTIMKSLPAGDVSAQIRLSGTAVEGVDYTVSSTNITLNGAMTSLVVVITIIDDQEVEGDETVVLNLVNASGANIVSPSTFTLTIRDNDSAPDPPPSGGGELLKFLFNTAPYLQVTTNVPHLLVSTMSLNTVTSTIETAQTDARYGFPDLPYIQARYGWASNTQAGAKAFQFTITPEEGYSLTITGIYFLAFANNSGPSAFGFDIGGLASGSMIAPDQKLVTNNTSISGVMNITEPLLVQIQGWTNGSRITTGAGYMRLDDLTLYGYLSPIATDLDQDNDGIPDALEQEWCGGNCDPDERPAGSPYTFRELYILDQPPTITNHFMINLLADTAGIHIVFPSTNSRRYAVEFNDNLATIDNWQLLSPPESGSNAFYRATDSTGPVTRAYRVAVRLDDGER